MKGDFTLLILKTLQIAAKTAVVISDEINEHSVFNTMRRFHGGMAKKYYHKPIFEKEIAALEKRQRISKIISKLKFEGLVKKDEKGFLKITDKGKNKAKQLEKRKIQTPAYTPNLSSDIKIITFDIPESLRLNRDWLRIALKQLKFTMLQKSVWVGKVELPEEFLEDLRKREIFDFVEIFVVTKSGTLKQLQ